SRLSSRAHWLSFNRTISSCGIASRRGLRMNYTRNRTVHTASTKRDAWKRRRRGSWKQSPPSGKKPRISSSFQTKCWTNRIQYTKRHSNIANGSASCINISSNWRTTRSRWIADCRYIGKRKGRWLCGEGNHGDGNGFGCRQDDDLHGALQAAFGRRDAGRPIQIAEHVAIFRNDGRRERDEPGAVSPGGSRADQACHRNESDSVEAAGQKKGRCAILWREARS